MRVTVNINTEKLGKDIGVFLERLQGVRKRSVLQMSKEVMEDIIDETAGPPPQPTVKYYNRTGQWLGGWGNAADFLGISLPTTKDTPRISRITGHSYALDDPHEYSFRAVNDVLYAEYIELTGTWKSPYPSRRPPYRYVTNKIENEETEQRFVEIIQENMKEIL